MQGLIPSQMTGSLYAYDVFDLANAAAESRLPRAFNAALSGAEKSKIEYQNSFGQKTHFLLHTSIKLNSIQLGIGKPL